MQSESASRHRCRPAVDRRRQTRRGTPQWASQLSGSGRGPAVQRAPPRRGGSGTDRGPRTRNTTLARAPGRPRGWRESGLPSRRPSEDRRRSRSGCRRPGGSGARAALEAGEHEDSPLPLVRLPRSAFPRLRVRSPAVCIASPSSHMSHSRSSSCSGSSAVARPSRFTVARASPRFHAVIPAAPRRRPAFVARRVDLLLGRAQLAEVAGRLLEVVADELVRAVRLPVEPVGVLPVQLRALRLRRARVDDVADEHVVEAVHVSRPGGRSPPVRAPAAPSSGPSAATAAAENRRPTTAARCASPRSSAPSRSRRLAISASIEPGTESSAASPSSRDVGRELLDVERVALGDLDDAVRVPARRRRARAPARRSAARARATPPSRSARRAARAAPGRGTRIGDPVACAPRYSTRSSSVGSAQWTSSNTSSSGRSAASSSNRRRAARKISPGRARPSRAPSACRSSPRAAGTWRPRRRKRSGRRARSPPRRAACERARARGASCRSPPRRRR